MPPRERGSSVPCNGLFSAFLGLLGVDYRFHLLMIYKDLSLSLLSTKVASAKCYSQAWQQRIDATVLIFNRSGGFLFFFLLGDKLCV